MVIDENADNFLNDEEPFLVLVGSEHCTKCMKAKKTIYELLQNGDLVEKSLWYVDGPKQEWLTRALCVSTIPSLVSVVPKNGIWTVSNSTTDIGTQKKILAYINEETESSEETTSDKNNTGE